jgi:hypothetical protein
MVAWPTELRHVHTYASGMPSLPPAERDASLRATPPDASAEFVVVTRESYGLQLED